MAISNYGELKTAVSNWLSRTDLSDRIPEFIALAESNIARDVRARSMERRVTATLSAQYEALPSDFLELRNVQLNTNPVRRLDFLAPEQLDVRYHGSGKPKAYSIIGNEIQLAPAPDAGYEAEIAYFARPTAFSADTDSNNLLTSYPGLYLYGALVAAQPFLHDDQRLATWAQLYQREVETLNETDELARSGATLARMN